MRQPVRIVSTIILCSIMAFWGPVRGVHTVRSAVSGSWTELSLAGLDIMCLAVAPLPSTTVYAGAWSAGVFRSTDGGVTWTPMNQGLADLDVFSLAVDPVNPSTLYAGTADGVFRSTDSGGLWIAANTGIAGEDVLALAIDPRTPTALYAGTWGDGIFRSMDSGASWKAVEYGSTDQWISSLAVDPVNPSTLYAGTADGVFRSTDGGSLWTAASTGLTDHDVRSLAVTPFSLYAATDGGGVFSSTDGGVGWIAMNTGLASMSIQCLAADPLTPSTLYAGTWGDGVYRWVNSGASWNAMNTGLTNMSVQCLAISPLAAATLYAGTFYGGVFRYDGVFSYVLSIAPSPSGSGTVSKDPSRSSYDSGTSVTLTATPAPGWTFAGWSGSLTGSANPASITMDADKTVIASFTEGPISSLITRYYSSILDRSPDEPGRVYWFTEITRIQSLGIDVREGFIALARLFFTSPEYLAKNTTPAAYITDLYETFFDRTPDPVTEVAYWTGLMAAGMSRDITMNWFVYSPEYATYMTGILGSFSTRPENNLVNDLYRGFLNRLPDTDGFTAQLLVMRAAQASGATAVRSTTLAIALNFMTGPEYALRARTNTQFIEDCYNGILRRGALAAEIQGWVDLLTAGATRTEVLTGFVNSPEFQLRVDQVIAAGPFIP